MFTRNYWLVRAASFIGRVTEVAGDTSTTGKPKLITVSGNVGANTSSSSYSYDDVSTNVYTNIYNSMKNAYQVDVSTNLANSSNSNTFGYGVFFGSGNEPVTVDDYKLSGDVVSGYTYSYKVNSTYAADGSNGIVQYDYTITNNNDTEITIGEVAIFGEATWQTSSSSSTKYTHHYYMFERTALETPITIPAGGVGQVTYAIHMNHPVTVATE